jgi:plastocyanin
MMRRIGVMVGALAVVAASAVVVFGGGAGAATRSVSIVGSDSFSPNAFVQSTFHYTPGTITVQSGDTVQWVNSSADPHTITVVRAGQVPATVNQVFNCKVCQSQAPSANVGAPGLDAPGDSLFVRASGSVSAPVTAKAGTTLHYICIFHPWMQGQIKVQ